MFEGGKEIAVYQKQLSAMDKEADADNKQAASDISYHLSQEAVNKFRENTKEAAEKSGLSKEEAARVALSESKIYQHLSEEFGEDVQNVKKVEITVPQAVEGQKMALDEALAEARQAELSARHLPEGELSRGRLLAEVLEARPGHLDFIAKRGKC